MSDTHKDGVGPTDDEQFTAFEERMRKKREAEEAEEAERRRRQFEERRKQGLVR